MFTAAILCSAVLAIGMPNAERACQHMELVVEVSEREDIKPEVLIALIHTESRWKPRVVSRANACGLTQVIPKWTGGRASGKVKYTCEGLKNPETSIRAGGKIFSFWLHNYAGCEIERCKERHYRVGLCGYNAGYRCKGKKPLRAGMRYSRIVLKKSKQIRDAATKILQRGSVDL